MQCPAAHGDQCKIDKQIPDPYILLAKETA
jgi:hypothetical protein